MSANSRARLAAGRRLAMPWRWCMSLPFVLLALAGCAGPQTAFDRQPDPAQSEMAVPSTTYRHVLDGYRSRRPAGPADWRGSNDGVAPKKDAP